MKNLSKVQFFSIFAVAALFAFSGIAYAKSGPDKQSNGKKHVVTSPENPVTPPVKNHSKPVTPPGKNK